MLIAGDKGVSVNLGELIKQERDRIMSDGPTGMEFIEAAAAVTPDFLGGQKLEDGIGLCLSGGGFRAMLFHLGAFIRLNELGLLRKLDRIASVSGGSIAAGGLAVAWNGLNFDHVAWRQISQSWSPIHS